MWEVNVVINNSMSDLNEEMDLMPELHEETGNFISEVNEQTDIGP